MAVSGRLLRAAGALLHRRAVEGIAVGALAALASLLAWHSGVLDRFEYATWSWRVHFLACGGPETKAVKLILLDQQSLDWGKKQIGVSWPWPREVYAPIIDFCTRNGAKAVIFDVLFSEPSPISVDDDRKLKEAIGRAPFFVASLCLHKEANFSRTWPASIPDRQLIDIVNLKRLMAVKSAGKFQRFSATFPIEEVAANAATLANVIAEPDADGIFRRLSLFGVLGANVVPSPGLAAFAAGHAAKGASPGGRARSFSPLTARLRLDRLDLCSMKVPLDREGKLILRFRGPPGAFKSYSAAAVIESEINSRSGAGELIKDAASFKGAYVFFGFSAPGLADLSPTPLGISPAVEIHATLLDNLLTGDFLRDLSPVWVIVSTSALAVLAALCLVSFANHPWQSVCWIALFSPLPVALGFATYLFGLWWPVVVQELAVTTALAGGIVLNYATEGRKKAFIKKAFRHYLSPAVIERILEDPSHLKLGGERKELSIFFSDLQGFSAISERLDPESLTRLLNRVLSDMTDIILGEGGTLDKYEGDAIIAFWNAPADQVDHAERAVRAALKCQEKIREQRQIYASMAGSPIRMRIGINTGPVVVGNMGSTKRFDYTVLGDAANLASRLEGANKFFGTNIMVSAKTWQKTSNRFSGRRLGFIRVVGRETPVEVFEPGADNARSDFNRALAFCLEKKWKQALELLEASPDDPPSRLYANRCRALLKDPDSDWDAIWNLVNK
ncbi:MAG: adenylate/guanylate cyclase domain-containing protein [Syntrophobacteraceae bacterium]|nr:adenylate/guanylate cyclase domain-containing protein [Syntrophobacteraceae bacterium]